MLLYFLIFLLLTAGGFSLLGISMRRFCRESGGELGMNFGIPQYGYVVETEHYRYCLRCKPQEGDYDGYLWCFDKRIQEMNQVQQENQDIGLLPKNEMEMEM